MSGSRITNKLLRDVFTLRIRKGLSMELILKKVGINSREYQRCIEIIEFEFQRAMKARET